MLNLPQIQQHQNNGQAFSMLSQLLMGALQSKREEDKAEKERQAVSDTTGQELPSGTPATVSNAILTHYLNQSPVDREIASRMRGISSQNTTTPQNSPNGNQGTPDYGALNQKLASGESHENIATLLPPAQKSANVPDVNPIETLFGSNSSTLPQLQAAQRMQKNPEQYKNDIASQAYQKLQGTPTGADRVDLLSMLQSSNPTLAEKYNKDVNQSALGQSVQEYKRLKNQGVPPSDREDLSSYISNMDKSYLDEKRSKPGYYVKNENGDLVPATSKSQKGAQYMDVDVNKLGDISGGAITHEPGTNINMNMPSGDTLDFMAKKLVHGELTADDLKGRNKNYIASLFSRADAINKAEGGTSFNFQKAQQVLTARSNPQYNNQLQQIDRANNTLDMVQDAYNSINNGDIKVLNSVTNKLKEIGGDPNVDVWGAVKNAVSREINLAVSKNSPFEANVKAEMEAFDRNKTPEGAKRLIDFSRKVLDSSKQMVYGMQNPHDWDKDVRGIVKPAQSSGSNLNIQSNRSVDPDIATATQYMKKYGSKDAAIKAWREGR